MAQTTYPFGSKEEVQNDQLVLIVSHEDFTILQVGSNVKGIIGYEGRELIGHPLTTLIGEDQMHNLALQLRSVSSIKDLQPIPCTISAHYALDRSPGDLVFDDRCFNMSLQTTGNSLVIRFDLASVRPLGYVAIPMKSIANSIEKLRKVSSLEDLLNISVKEMRNIIHVDRVMIYNFDDVYRIKILAEDKEIHIQPLIHHYYPASYISEEQRAAYLRNDIKISLDIDTSSTPPTSPSDSARDEPSSLSQAVLKCVSLNYTKAQDLVQIRFSMSIPIITDWRLWGLIVCQHSKSKFVSHQIRVSCELFGQIVSWKMVNVLALMQSQDAQACKASMASFADALIASDNWTETLLQKRGAVLELFSATGLAISCNPIGICCETSPTKEQIEKLLPHIISNCDQGVFSNNCLSIEYPEAYAYKDAASGLLALILSMTGHQSEVIMLFRKETHETIEWVDRPETSENIDGHSKPWSDLEIEMAHQLRRHLLETQLRYYSRIVKDKADKRASIAEELREKQGLFIDTMCHEIRNPINGIIGSLAIANDHLDTMERRIELTKDIDQDFRQLRESLNNISDCANHQKIIANDVLSFSALEQRRIRLNIGPINLTQLLQQILSRYKVITDDKGLTLQEQIFDHEVYILSDRHRLKQIIGNLLDNAIKFTTSGFIKVTSILHSLDKQHQGSFQISIEDSGVGMTQEEISRLFVPYSQANQSISAKYGGTGLGLVISQELARLMKGKISIHSQPNQGTLSTLHFSSTVITREQYLDFLPPTTNEHTTRSISQPLPEITQVKKILIVEDNLINQKVLSKILTKAGYSCDIANNGYEGLELSKLHRYKVIFMDIQMPIMDGLEATERIREWESSANLFPSYIICLSGNARKEHQQKAFDSGVDAYIVKPFNREEILDLIVKLPKKYFSQE